MRTKITGLNITGDGIVFLTKKYGEKQFNEM